MLRVAEGVLADQPDALAVGPGLGSDARARALLALALAHEVPLVLDADALNLIATDTHPCRRRGRAQRAHRDHAASG